MRLRIKREGMGGVPEPPSLHADLTIDARPLRSLQPDAAQRIVEQCDHSFTGSVTDLAMREQVGREQRLWAVSLNFEFWNRPS